MRSNPRTWIFSWAAAVAFALGLCTVRSFAGPPYRSDDPEPTDYQHYEIYAFTNGIINQDGTSGAGGIDFNYGGAPNLQLTATLPVGYTFSSGGPFLGGLSNIELAAKYRFLTQANFGLDVAVFPRVFLPSASSNVGESHVSFLLPIWVEKDWGKWSAFGGGGCEINRGGSSQDFCLAGLVITNQITPKLQVGLEMFHQTSDTQGGSATTSLGTGVRYDLNEHYHLLGYVGRGIENAQANDRVDWYAAVLFTF
jgi:Putative MetA-pathway of phenol degradation